MLPGARAASLAAVLPILGCGQSSVPSPFVERDAGPDAPDAASDASPVDAADAGPPLPEAAMDAGPGLGGPCVDDAQCDDGIDCTFDVCDQAFGRCRATPDDTQCADEAYCNGIEICHPLLGCRPGEPVACSDDSTCTIDACVEDDRTCTHSPRDADGDGDPDHNCPGGGDCNETDPFVSSLGPEVCSNARDDDCDGTVDETDGCEPPEYDTCIDPFEITASGTFEISTLAASSDVSATCGGSGGRWRDVIAAVVLAGGPRRDVEVTAFVPGGNVGIAAAELCGDASTELGCVDGLPHPDGGRSARLRLRDLPPANLPVYVFTDVGTTVTLDVELLDPTTAPTNETCAGAEPVVPGEHRTAELVDAGEDVITACNAVVGDLVYSFELTSKSDVEIFGTSLDGTGIPTISLRGPGCSAAQEELTCQTTSAPALFARGLDPGTYFVVVSATAPTDVDFVVEVGPPTEPPPDDTCEGAPALVPNTTFDASFDGHADDLDVGCFVGARDVAYALDLSERSDVLVVERTSSRDTGAVSVARPPCASEDDALVCNVSSRTPVRAAAHDIGPGSFRVVAETLQSSPITLTALTRPAVAPVVVPFSDGCDDAVEIDPGGGFYTGNTANVSADLDASCDRGGEPPGGAPEQLLRLELAERRRVVLDTRGSILSTVLVVRRGPDCPGEELVGACAAGFVPDKSFLDLVLDPGTYFVQIDGYAGDGGPWQLEVYSVEP